MSPKQRTALVLSGGGSRGAYEAGILRYLRGPLARRLGRQPTIDIVAGTSVGAINGAFVAATSDDLDHQGERIAAAWRSLRIEELIRFGPREAWSAMRALVGRQPPPPKPGSFRYGGLVNTDGMKRFVAQTVPWDGIARGLKAGRLHSLAVSATHVGSGHTQVFIHSREPVPEAWSRDPFVRHSNAHIAAQHVLASAAIPLLFPAVKIGGHFYTDGGLRQNTPLSPAIRLGANRVLVISLRHVAKGSEVAELEEARVAAYPKPLFIAGKALNALLLDHTDYDLDRMARLNAILEAGTEAFGADFPSIINRTLVQLRGAPIRPVTAVHIRPSQDIGRLAADFARDGCARIESRMVRTALDYLARGESAGENDLLSYLLFDGDFAAQLIDLGYADAKANEDQLLEFFTGGDCLESSTGRAAGFAGADSAAPH